MLHFVSGALIVEKVYLLPLCILILKVTRSAIAMTATAKQLLGDHQSPREIFVSGALIVKKVCMLLLYTVTDSLGSLHLYRVFPVVHSDLALRSTFAPLMSARSGDCVVSASEDGAVYFFDVSKSSRACINKLQAHSSAAMAVAFNYSETFLATSDKSGLVIVWKR